MTIEAIKRQWELISNGQFSKDLFLEDVQVIFVAIVWVGLIIAMLTFGACKQGGKHGAKLEKSKENKHVLKKKK